MINQLLAWAQKNERHLGAAVFLGGFVTDILTFTLLDVSFVNIFFLGYLTVAALATLVSHVLFARLSEQQSTTERALAVLSSLISQYAIGGILSGCLIFYTKSAALTVSWPFLILLALVFISNEVFRKHRENLAFQTILLFFALYAYLIFALPIYLKQIGPLVFAASTVASVAVFVLFLFVLAQLGAKRLRESIRSIVGAMLVTVFILSGAYVTGVIPPLPLNLRESGVYHTLRRAGDAYVLMSEKRNEWWDIRTPVVHLAPGEHAVVFAAVAAPVRFSTAVVHHWQRYNTDTNRWDEGGRVPFSITGGRDGGYRGYSEKAQPAAGRWRVSVETKEGQVIGRISFEIKNVSSVPPLHEETH